MTSKTLEELLQAERKCHAETKRELQAERSEVRRLSFAAGQRTPDKEFIKVSVMEILPSLTKEADTDEVIRRKLDEVLPQMFQNFRNELWTWLPLVAYRSSSEQEPAAMESVEGVVSDITPEDVPQAKEPVNNSVVAEDMIVQVKEVPSCSHQLAELVEETVLQETESTADSIPILYGEEERWEDEMLKKPPGEYIPLERDPESTAELADMVSQS